MVPAVRAQAVYREVLSSRDARSLIAGSATSRLGDWFFTATLLGYVFADTGSATLLGAAAICRLLPAALLGPILSEVADRYDRRTVLLTSDLLRCALTLGVAGVVAADGPIVLIVALTALASTAGVADRSSATALLPRLVGEARLGPANALLQTVHDLGAFFGPALGAVLLAVVPGEGAFVATAGTFGISAVLIGTMRRAPVTSAPNTAESLTAQLADEFRAARATPFVVPLFLAVLMIELTYGAQMVQLVVIAEERLALGSGGYGWLLAMAGVGGVLSALFSPRLTTGENVSATVVVAGLACCAAQLGYTWTELPATALVITVFGGIGRVACKVVAETALARVARPGSLSQVMRALAAVSVTATVVGATLAAFLVEQTSLTTSLLLLGVGAMVVVALCLPALRGLDLLSRQRSELLTSRVAVLEHLPIVAGAPRLVVEMLASSAHVCPLPPGVDIVVQGAPAHALYVVIDGRVVVQRDGKTVDHIGPGGQFGERGLLDNAPRNATVTTEVDTTLLRLEGDAFLEAIQTSPSILSATDRSSRSGRPAATGEPTAWVDDPSWTRE